MPQPNSWDGAWRKKSRYPLRFYGSARCFSPHRKSIPLYPQSVLQSKQKAAPEVCLHSLRWVSWAENPVCSSAHRTPELIFLFLYHWLRRFSPPGQLPEPLSRKAPPESRLSYPARPFSDTFSPKL